MMPLAHAHDALEDMVMHFYNEMLRRGVKEMTPLEWGEAFRSWFSPCEFVSNYERTMKWLAEHDARAASPSPEGQRLTCAPPADPVAQPTRRGER